MSELKPCPFCKCTEIVAGKDYTRDYYRVDCLGCSAFITAPSLELAIQYWNTRPIEDTLRAELEKRTAGLHDANAVCMEMKHELDRLKEENHALDQINRDIQTAAAHLDEVLAELARRDEEVAELRKQKYIPVHDTLTDAGKEYYEKCIRQEKELARREARIAELEQEVSTLAEKLHDEMSQLEIATDLGNKRWLALNDIYENGEKHNTNWCKRKAQEGLGIK